MSSPHNLRFSNTTTALHPYNNHLIKKIYTAYRTESRTVGEIPEVVLLTRLATRVAIPLLLLKKSILTPERSVFPPRRLPHIQPKISKNKPTGIN